MAREKNLNLDRILAALMQEGGPPPGVTPQADPLDDVLFQMDGGKLTPPRAGVPAPSGAPENVEGYKTLRHVPTVRGTEAPPPYANLPVVGGRSVANLRGEQADAIAESMRQAFRDLTPSGTILPPGSHDYIAEKARRKPEDAGNIFGEAVTRLFPFNPATGKTAEGKDPRPHMDKIHDLVARMRAGEGAGELREADEALAALDVRERAATQEREAGAKEGIVSARAQAFRDAKDPLAAELARRELDLAANSAGRTPAPVASREPAVDPMKALFGETRAALEREKANPPDPSEPEVVGRPGPVPPNPDVESDIAAKERSMGDFSIPLDDATYDKTPLDILMEQYHKEATTKRSPGVMDFLTVLLAGLNPRQSPQGAYALGQSLMGEGERQTARDRYFQLHQAKVNEDLRKQELDRRGMESSVKMTGREDDLARRDLLDEERRQDRRLSKEIQIARMNATPFMMEYKAISDQRPAITAAQAQRAEDLLIIIRSVMGRGFDEMPPNAGTP